MTSSSPAPRSHDALGPGDGVEAGRLAAALDDDLPGGLGRRGGGARIDRDDDRLAPEPAGAPRDERRVGDGRGVERDLVGAGPQDVAHLVDGPHAAADGQRDERPARRPLDDVEQRAAPLGRGRDVEEDELVGALGRVALGQLGRIALVDEVDEAGALDDAAVGDVEAGDDAAAEHQAARTSRHEVGEQAQAVGAAPLGVELDAEQRPAGDRRRRTAGRARSSARTASLGGAAGGRAGVRVDEVEVGAVGDAVEQRVLARALDLVPADVRAGSGRPRGATVRPGEHAERRRAVLVAALEQELQAEADAEERPVGAPATRGSARRGRARSRRAIAGAAAPTPGHDERVGAARAPRRRGRRATSAPDGRQRLLDADEVAGAVVDDGDARSRPVIRASPWSRRRPSRRGSGSQATRSARPSALNAASARWWSLRPVPRRWSVAPGGPRERLERVLDELERQAADALAAERQVDDRVRPAADVDDGRRERLVHRDGAVAEPADPGAIAERLGERGTRGRARRPRPCGARRPGGRRRPGSRGRTGRGGRASRAGGRRSRSRCRSPVWPAPSRPSVTVMSVSRGRPGDRHAAALARPDRRASPSGVVMRRSPRARARSARARQR